MVYFKATSCTGNAQHPQDLRRGNMGQPSSDDVMGGQNVEPRGQSKVVLKDVSIYKQYIET